MRAPLKWKPEPDEHDYPAAQDYLELVMGPSAAARLVAAFRTASVVPKKAKDLLRATEAEPLGYDNVHVAKDLKKIERGEKLSPILVVRGSLHGPAPEIADGYHRLCAVYSLDEDAEVACKLVDLGVIYNPTEGSPLIPPRGL